MRFKSFVWSMEERVLVALDVERRLHMFNLEGSDGAWPKLAVPVATVETGFGGFVSLVVLIFSLTVVETQELAAPLGWARLPLGLVLVEIRAERNMVLPHVLFTLR